MADKSSEGIWAVVYAAGGRYLGCLAEEANNESNVKAMKTVTLDRVDHDVSLKLMPAYDLAVQMVPIPIGPGKMAMQREISAGPVGMTLDPDEAPLYVKATAIQFFDDMKPADRARYKNLVEQARKLCLEARARESGIQMAGSTGGPKLSG